MGGLALATSPDFVGGAVPTFTPPGFDGLVGPTAGSHTGFRMPVPRETTGVTLTTGGLRFFGVGRDGRAASWVTAEHPWRLPRRRATPYPGWAPVPAHMARGPAAAGPT